MLPASVTMLYWSIRGEVACAEHTPDSDNPRWNMEGWAPVSGASGRFHDSRYQCQHCAIDGRPLVHPYIGTAH
jgi:hypothetical protein